MANTAAAHAGEHAHHPSSRLYLQIAVILFALTALEVAGYEITHPEAGAALSGLGAALQPIFVEVLLALSAAKFALVAMYYMHLKQDQKILSWIFVFSLIIASFVIVGLIVLFYYHYSF